MERRVASLHKLSRKKSLASLLMVWMMGQSACSSILMKGDTKLGGVTDMLEKLFGLLYKDGLTVMLNTAVWDLLCFLFGLCLYDLLPDLEDISVTAIAVRSVAEINAVPCFNPQCHRLRANKKSQEL